MWLFLFLFSLSPSFGTFPVSEINAINGLNKGVNVETPNQCMTCHDEDKPGCSQAFDKFCDNLYSTENLGNMNIRLSDNSNINIRFGSTNERNMNPISEAFYEARLAAENNLPQDLRRLLQRNGYFRKLKKYIESVKKKTFGGAQEDKRELAKISDLWDKAYNEVVFNRTSKVIPNFENKEELNYAESLKRYDVINRLGVEINAATWKDHPSWKKIEGDFKTLKAQYLNFIRDNKTLSQDTKNRMIDKINDLKLAIPGTNKDSVDWSCARTEVNAYYMPRYNEVTVCAGLFSTPSIAVLSHEIAHAIDPNNLLRDEVNDSAMAKNFESFLQKSCSSDKPSCDDWTKIKNELEDFKMAPTPYYSDSYLQCLRNKKLKDWPENNVIQEIATTDVESYVDRMAQNHQFLRLTAPKIRNDEGVLETNVYYMNVCELFDIKSFKYNMRADILANLAFVNEYKCSDKTKSDERITEAIDKAKALMIRFSSNKIASEGRLNENDQMVRKGYAAAIGERTADNVGLNVASDVLRSQYPDTSDRRNVVFSSTSLFCDGYSITADYPEEAVAEKKFSSEEHSQDHSRRRELMTEDIRELLSCEKDSDIPDCSL